MDQPPLPVSRLPAFALDRLRRACARFRELVRLFPPWAARRLFRLWAAGRRRTRTAPDDAADAEDKKPPSKKEAREAAKKAAKEALKKKAEDEAAAAEAAELAMREKAEEANMAVAEARARLEDRRKAEKADKKARVKAARSARAEAAKNPAPKNLQGANNGRASSPRPSRSTPRPDHEEEETAKNPAAKNARAGNEQPAPSTAASTPALPAALRGPEESAKNLEAASNARASSPTPASPATAAPSRSTPRPDPEEEEFKAHKRYWALNQTLKKKKITPCLICYLEDDDRVVEIKNADKAIDRHVERIHKPGVLHCEKSGCFVFGRDGRQIGLHQYLAHEMSFR